MDPCRHRIRALTRAGIIAIVLAAGPRASRAAPADPPLPESRWRAFQTGALRADRLQHASLAFSIGLGAGLTSRDPAVAVTSGAVLGVAKEFLDMRTSHFDWADLAADLAGAGLAALATRSLER